MDRVFSRTRGGFYFLIASPRTQAAALARYTGGNVAVYDFSKAEDAGEGRHIIQILRLTQREPDRDIYVYQNFQLALWDSTARDGLGDWDVDAIRRLNYSRDQLNHLRRRMVFCMTPEADDQLNRHAMDFYDFVQLFLRLEDEAEERPAAVERVRPVDRSVGVDVKVDFRKSEEELLNQAIALGNQAWELREATRFADAIRLYNKQIEIREKILGENHIDTAIAYDNLGMTFYEIGNHIQALNLLKKSLIVKEKELGIQHPNTASTYDHLGIIFRRMGNYDRALEWFKKALNIQELISGIDVPDTLGTYRNIGETYERMGNYGEALDWLQKAVYIIENSIDGDLFDFAKVYNDLGVVYNDIGDHAQALAWHQKAHTILEQICGPDNLHTAASCNNLGATYAYLGDYSQAIVWEHQALDIFEKVLDINHPNIAWIYYTLGITYGEMGDYDHSLEWLLKAVSIDEKALGKSHPYTIKTYRIIARIYKHKRKKKISRYWRDKIRDALKSRNTQSVQESIEESIPAHEGGTPLGTANPH
ncbi:MAG: tetratricopeptide repeat protein [Oscillibacter sp.]|nr:tetratricopeptide repeat protein [Oscillibacter sp.]